MNRMLENKRILVMGVANKWSIAWGCAQALKEQGAQVIYTYQNERTKKSLEALVEEEDILIPCDVTIDEDLDNAFNLIKEQVETVDGIIHSIAFAKAESLHEPFVNTDRVGYQIAQDISAYSLVAVSKRAQDIMPEGGSIITMTYIGSQRVIPNYNVMGVAKAALEASVRYLAGDLGKKNIRINAISAGAIKTLAAKGIKEFDKLLKVAEERTPLGRTVTVKEVGNTAAFLCSDFSTGITGEIIHVDGGFHIS